MKNQAPSKRAIHQFDMAFTDFMIKIIDIFRKFKNQKLSKTRPWSTLYIGLHDTVLFGVKILFSPTLSESWYILLGFQPDFFSCFTDLWATQCYIILFAHIRFVFKKTGSKSRSWLMIAGLPPCVNLRVYFRGILLG